jgi:hypothetical protein
LSKVGKERNVGEHGELTADRDFKSSRVKGVVDSEGERSEAHSHDGMILHLTGDVLGAGHELDSISVFGNFRTSVVSNCVTKSVVDER